MKKVFLFVLFAALVATGKAQTENTDGQGDQIRQFSQSEISEGGSGLSVEDVGVISEGIGQLNAYLNLARSAQDLYNSSRSLSNGECAPDFTTNANDLMPSSCESMKCQDCYSRAVNELTFVRRQLGRLSCIYRNTRNFNQSAIAFGDNASGIHAVTGLAWQNARAEIVAEYENFKRAYDEKYQGMMGSLEKALKAIGECENQYGGQRDWYQRFGFIYFQMMQDKYKRTD